MTLAHRTSGPADGPVVLLLHGVPESSRMWRHVLPAIGTAGWRAVAPDLPGHGDSPPLRPGTWTAHVDELERFRQELGIERCVLVVHDWGGLIGLRWACDNPGVADALVISGTGFFPDGRWHGMAKALRTPGTGEELMDAISRDLLAAGLRQAGSDLSEDEIDACWRAYEDPDRRAAQLELYRSGDFEQLVPYEGQLAALGLPALLVWGAIDPFAPVASAHRFERELPDTELVVVDDAGHFVWEEAPEPCVAAVGRFLERLPRAPG